MFVCYICQLFHGGNHGGTRIDNTLKRYKKKEKMFKKGEKQHKNLFLDDEAIALRVKSCLTLNLLMLFPFIPAMKSLLYLSFSDHLFPLFLSLSISAVSTSAFCNFKQNSD